MQRNKPGTKVLRPLRPLVGQLAVPQVSDLGATKKVVVSDSHIEQETREIESRPEVVESGAKVIITDSPTRGSDHSNVIITDTPSGVSDQEPTLLPRTSIQSDKGVDLSARLTEPTTDLQHKQELNPGNSDVKEIDRKVLPVDLPQYSEVKTETQNSDATTEIISDVRTKTVHKEIRASEDSDKKQKDYYAAPIKTHKVLAEELAPTSSHKLEEPNTTTDVAPVQPNAIRPQQLLTEKVEPRTVSVFAKPLPTHPALRPQERPRPVSPHKRQTRPVVEIGTIEVRVVGKKEVALPTPEPRKPVKSPVVKPSRLERSSLAVYGWRQS